MSAAEQPAEQPAAEQPVPRPCPGCGLVAEPAEGPVHAYIGASPGCWARFGELTVVGLSGVPAGYLAGDTYAVQHPGEPERRAIQSIAVHLVTLCALLERAWRPEKAIALRRRVADHPPEPWPRLEVPWPVGHITVGDVLAAAAPVERNERIRVWAGDVWTAYAEHQDRVRGWLDRVAG